MKAELELCDICECPVPHTKHGICIEMGYSNGGWGSRKNHIKFTGEVCQNCYDEHKSMAKAISEWLKERKGSRRPTITVDEVAPHPPPKKAWKEVIGLPA